MIAGRDGNFRLVSGCACPRTEWAPKESEKALGYEVKLMHSGRLMLQVISLRWVPVPTELSATAIANIRPRCLDVTIRHMRYLWRSSLWQYTDVCLSHVIYTVSLSIQGCGRLQSIWNTWYMRWYDLSFRPHSFTWYSSSPSCVMLSKLLFIRQNFSKLKFLPGVVAQTLLAERSLLVCSF